MTVLWVMLLAIVVLVLAGRFYSRFLARSLGEDPTRITPAIAKEDGTDYVPTPTTVVFAHHFASIAGAGPIVGPVLAIVYGWAPALIWVLGGSILIGAVHDYLATYMTTREGGHSIATIAKRLLGRDAFIALTILLVLMLALVCAAFLNLSAAALTSMVAFDRLELPTTQSLFRIVTVDGVDKVVIGGIASMSVVCITAVAPLIGFLYLKKKVAVWKCSLMAIAVCAASITVGLFLPISFNPMVWKLLLSAYVLIAAGVPVWIFLQSRDFINVHILYVGMAALLLTLVVAGMRGVGTADGIPAVNIQEGTQAMNGWVWPTMFIVIACGAVSGFHSLCAGGTTCKQLTNERAARQIGYYGMLLEGFLAVCVIAVMMIGAVKLNYIVDVHPKYALSAYAAEVGQSGLTAAKSNAVLGFAMAVGNAASLAFGVPIAVGALAGMILLEGFLVTTLDTAIRLTRYLIEEIWRTLFGKYDVFAEPAGAQDTQEWGEGEHVPVGAEGLPIVPPDGDIVCAATVPTSGLLRGILRLLRQYWLNSALAVGLMLAFGLKDGWKALWGVFATSNQLLAAMVLSLASLWLLRQKRRIWFAFLPAVAMLITTATSLVLMLLKFLKAPGENMTLLIADIVIMVLATYLFIAGVRAAVRFFRERDAGSPAQQA
jgi:carbon starvation protein